MTDAGIHKSLHCGDSVGNTDSQIQDKVEVTVNPAAVSQHSAQGRCEQLRGFLLLQPPKREIETPPPLPYKISCQHTESRP